MAAGPKVQAAVRWGHLTPPPLRKGTPRRGTLLPCCTPRLARMCRAAAPGSRTSPRSAAPPAPAPRWPAAPLGRASPGAAACISVTPNQHHRARPSVTRGCATPRTLSHSTTGGFDSPPDYLLTSDVRSRA
eukprot:7659736-Pyramimonas_sp.AAC.2